MNEQLSERAQTAIKEVHLLREYERLIALAEPGQDTRQLEGLVRELSAKHPKIDRSQVNPLSPHWDEEPATPAEALMYTSVFARMGEALNGWPW